MSRLIACLDCSRHIFVDTACPFCGAKAERSTRAGRAAALVLGSALAVAPLMGCGDNTTPTPLYGIPPSDASQDSAADATPDGAADAATDAEPDSTAIPAYGIPPADGG